MKGPELKIHIAIFNWIKAVAPQCIPFHAANGGWRTASEGAQFQALGVLPGIPDIGVIASGGCVYWIEVKSDEGTLSKAQRAVHERFMLMSVPYAVCRSIDDARTAFSHWKIETREVQR